MKKAAREASEKPMRETAVESHPFRKVREKHGAPAHQRKMKD